ncbi:MAG TPA: flagellar export chaperone FliS [Rhodocyclaceae bacterium]
MFRMTPSDAYRSVELQSQIEEVSPHKLVLMLFEGALLSIAHAQRYIDDKNIPEKGKAISKAIDIIAQGLKASLNMEAGGDLSDKLYALYDYMIRRLLFANMNNDKAALVEVSNLLRELKSGWEEIANDPAVLSANR